VSTALFEPLGNRWKLSPLDPCAFNTRIGMASALACLGEPVKAVAIACHVNKSIRRHMGLWLAGIMGRDGG
jgi:hypothetical protein